MPVAWEWARTLVSETAGTNSSERKYSLWQLQSAGHRLRNIKIKLYQWFIVIFLLRISEHGGSACRVPARTAGCADIPQFFSSSRALRGCLPSI
jgi:hypothetical protein